MYETIYLEMNTILKTKYISTLTFLNFLLQIIVIHVTIDDKIKNGLGATTLHVVMVISHDK
jgi:hypothetical protein